MIRNIFIIALTALALQGCFFVVGAAAGAAGVAVVYDHRTLAKIIQDRDIANNILDKIKINSALAGSHIDVSCFNQIVLLTGQVQSNDLRQTAEDIAKNEAGVMRVYNQLSVRGPTSTLTRTSDSWITTKIRTEMLATKGLASGTIRVVTENGSVYLMGIVTEEQADTAVNIARQVSGVQSVMKIFQYK